MFPKRSLISLFSLLLFLSCGYRFGSILTTGENRIFIEKVENESYYFFEADFENMIRDEFNKRGIRTGNSKTTLIITVKEAEKSPISFDDSGIIMQYRINALVHYQLSFEDSIVKEGEIRDHGIYYPEGPENNTEEHAIGEIIEKISVKIVDNCIDRW